MPQDAIDVAFGDLNIPPEIHAAIKGASPGALIAFLRIAESAGALDALTLDPTFLDGINALADTLRAEAGKINAASWALDSALSARRKAKAGYRNPDPSTGRVQEHHDVKDIDILRPFLRAAEILTFLEVPIPPAII